MNAEDDLGSTVKKIVGAVIFILLTLLFVYWLYQNIIKETMSSSPINANQSSIQASSSLQVKRKNKMTISLQGILPISSTDFTKGKVYQLLDKLSNDYDLFFIVLINDNDDKEAIIKKFTVLIDDNIIFQHVSQFIIINREYCSVRQ